MKLVIFFIFFISNTSFLIFSQVTNFNSEIIYNNNRKIFRKGYLYEREGFIKQLSLSGTHYEMGLQYGVLLKEDIIKTAAFVDKLLEIFAKERFLAPSFLKSYIHSEIRKIAKSIPSRFMDEMSGMSDGCGLKKIDIMTINMLSDFFALHGCTGIFVKDSNGTIHHGRSMDIPWGSDWPSTVIIKFNPSGFNSFTSVTWAGFGDAETTYNKYFSFSQNSIFVNKVNKSGMPFYYLSRLVMEESTCIDEIVSLFKKNKTINGEKAFFKDLKSNTAFIIDLYPLDSQNIRLFKMDNDFLWGINLYTDNEFDRKYQNNSFIKNGNNKGREILLRNFEKQISKRSKDDLIEIFRTFTTYEGIDYSKSFYYKGINNQLTTQVVIFSSENNGVYLATGPTFAASNNLVFYPDDFDQKPYLYKHKITIHESTIDFGMAAYKLDSNKNLLKLYEELVQKYPSDLRFLTMYASKLFEMHKIKKAIQIYEKALNIEPDNIEVNIDLLKIYLKTQNINKSIEVINKLNKFDIPIEKNKVFFNNAKLKLSKYIKE